MQDRLPNEVRGMLYHWSTNIESRHGAALLDKEQAVTPRATAGIQDLGFWGQLKKLKH